VVAGLLASTPNVRTWHAWAKGSVRVTQGWPSGTCDLGIRASRHAHPQTHRMSHPIKESGQRRTALGREAPRIAAIKQSDGRDLPRLPHVDCCNLRILVAQSDLKLSLPFLPSCRRQILHSPHFHSLYRCSTNGKSRLEAFGPGSIYQFCG